MTITDDERREVARRLRETAKGKFDFCAHNIALEIGMDDPSDFDECFDVEHLEAWHRLADLIEPQPITGDTSDGYHTFDELYDHRAKLFSVIVRCFRNRAWKSKLHHDGTMYEDMFIVGVETPQGQATYHYDIDPYWDIFDCKELVRAPEWDGHTPEQAISRIASLRPSCDRDALLELADRMDGYARFCKERSIQVGNNLVECYALRIRDAVDACEACPDAPVADDEGQDATDAYMDDSEAAEGYHRVDVSDKFNENIAAIDFVRENGGLEAVKARLMPEGMEWPCYEDGEPVRIGDEFECWCGETHTVGSVTIREGRSTLNESQPHSFVVSDGQFTAHGQRVKRPAVLAADGEPLEVGQTVWTTRDHDEFTVVDPSSDEEGFLSVKCTGKDGKTYFAYPGGLTHQCPVLDADGVPIKKGDHGWWVEQPGVEIVVKHIDPDECDQLTVCDVHGRGNTIGADEFTHTKPDLDTWERIEDDATLSPEVYCHRNGIDISQKDGTEIFLADTVEPMTRDLVRRCKELARKENNNE